MINFNRRGLLKKIGALLGYMSIPGCLSVFNKGKTMEKMKKVIYHQRQSSSIGLAMVFMFTQ